MEDTSNSSLKRVRQEEENEEIIKRQKSYKDIITLLEEEEDDPNEDISSLISTLQEEIISSTGLNPVQPGSDDLNRVYSGSDEFDRVCSGSGGEEEEVEKVMKHLLEASDDELGIPNLSGEMNGYDVVDVDEGHVDGGDLFLPVGEGLWEFEDHEANNYYEYSSLLQSEIFM
ncbi:uncharacterized protein LOC141598718 [Silene latifolia]|uniref:uncharacterized protein LOC141598718 n=1 Tax=Silene latifolia TaxID=37657 RepID=UPI003D787E3A